MENSSDTTSCSIHMQLIRPFFLFKITMLANLNNIKRHKIFCGLFLFVTAFSLFVWNFALNTERTKWSIKWIATKKSNIKRSSILGKQLIKYSKSPRHKESTDHKKSLIRTNSPNSTNVIGVEKVNTSISEPFPRKVLIISRGRSGSSFLGELFNQNKEAFYLFEPLGWARKDPSLYEEERFKVIDDLYKCKFANKMYLNFLIKEKFFRTKTEKLSTFPGQCSKISRSAHRCLWHILKSSCLGSKTVVTKVLTHRLPQNGLKGIMEILDAHKELKIIHLIRDPRRVIASMKKAGWFEGKIFNEQVQRICSSMWANIKHVQNESIYYKHRYKLLVFADMMVSPTSTVVELYDFLKLGPVPRYLFSWIVKNTMGFDKASHLKSTYETSRNSTEVLTRKVDFSTTEEISINTHCDAVIKFIDSIRNSGS